MSMLSYYILLIHISLRKLKLLLFCLRNFHQYVLRTDPSEI